jgi:hypothetical protein
LLHCCCSVVTLLLHGSHTVVTHTYTPGIPFSAPAGRVLDSASYTHVTTV